MKYELRYEFTIEETVQGNGDYHGRILVATFSTKSLAIAYYEKHRARLTKKYGNNGTLKITPWCEAPHDPL